MVDGEHPNWEYAKAVLRSIVPSAKSFLPEHILTETNNMVECDLEEFDTDHDRFKYLLIALDTTVSGSLIIVSDSSYMGAGPYFTSVEFVEFFLEAHPDSVMTSGDLVFLSPALSRCIVLHHSGLATVIEGKQRQSFESSKTSLRGLDDSSD